MTQVSSDVLKCSFCHKSQRDVRKLIAGPTVYICDECVYICLQIVSEEALPKGEAVNDERTAANEALAKAQQSLLRHNLGSAYKRLIAAADHLDKALTLAAIAEIKVDGSREPPADSPGPQEVK